jgi:hypothetical protein
MQEPYRLAENVASPSATRRVALVAWGMSICLILSATVIRILEGDNLLQYANIICSGIAYGSFGTVGALIIWQRPRNTIGWICLTVGIGTGITDFSGAYTAYGTVKGYLPLPGTEVFNWLGNIVWPLNLILILVFLPLLFPNGHLLTRRWRIVFWLAAVLLILNMLVNGLVNGLSVVFIYVFGKGLSADSLSALDVDLNLLALPLALAALVSLILRFIRARERERQQIKWLTYGAVMMLVLIVGGYFVWQDPNSATDGLTFNLAIMLLPLSIGISILLNQLYGIDRLINHTLVYGLLIVILLLTYLLLVFVGQHLLVSLLGQNNGVVLVASTLAVAALFQPLRRRIQEIIDRRFYRSKYDSAKTLEAFSATLRSEVDLNQLREHLLNVVQETMQPAHVSLWLRSPERHSEEPRHLEKPNTLEEGF